ncbi:PID-CTERM protein-sorting domain-containing protein [Peijinzhouia sedimentorum]
MKIAILTFSLLFLSLLSYAQTFGGPPSFTPDVLDNPIDGGLSLLLGAGAVYGAKKLKDQRAKKKKNRRKS